MVGPDNRPGQQATGLAPDSTAAIDRPPTPREEPAETVVVGATETVETQRDNLLEAIFTLMARKWEGKLDIHRLFTDMDVNTDRALTKNEFEVWCSNNEIATLSAAVVDSVFEFFTPHGAPVDLTRRVFDQRIHSITGLYSKIQAGALLTQQQREERQAKLESRELVLDRAQDIILDALHSFAAKRHSTVSAVFHAWDKDQSGGLQKQELHAALDEIGVQSTQPHRTVAQRTVTPTPPHCSAL